MKIQSNIIDNVQNCHFEELNFVKINKKQATDFSNHKFYIAQY